MAALDALQLLGSVGFIVALVPQFIRTIRTKHANDVDPWFLILVLAASVLSLAYSVPTRQWFFAASFASNLLVWGAVLYYRLRPAPAPVPPEVPDR